MVLTLIYLLCMALGNPLGSLLESLNPGAVLVSYYLSISRITHKIYISNVMS